MRKTPKQEVPNEDLTIADVWEKAKRIAPRMSISPSTLYSLIRRGSTIPHVKLSSGIIVFNWASVNRWLHELEANKRKRNFED
ncbi:MAG: hypothetical protein ABSH06_21265 [Thermodesulfobacteriota bacterium]